jgi:hypothetical protein
MNGFQASVKAGLSTSQHKVITAGVYKLSAFTTVLPVSGITVTLSQSGSTTASIASTQTQLGESVTIEKSFNCAIGDMLMCQVTSSTPMDQPPNMIKTVISLNRIS